MQIRYLEAMQAMAKSGNSKVIFMPSASGIGAMAVDKDDPILKEGTSAGPSGEPTLMFNITEPEI